MFTEKFESVGCYYILYSVGITIYTTLYHQQRLTWL